ncbi:MAG TPA: hypothetical protein GX523_17225 [Desulfitobacterium dehalogenans]|uniref:Uncharacterized protein n=1 Tax=Desulfitobacterium dehalogenans TaxID=36854 RepID=A0A7C6Z6J7_9FIRM|nr:hypothetical protein [Desulfitobacterium dehalogenans]
MPGGRPTKPLALVQGHRTKEEKKVREEAEKKLLTGVSLKEWPEVKADPAAHKEFLRVKKVLKAIDKDDALHEGVINRYCLLHGECKKLEVMKQELNAEALELYAAKQNGEVDFLTYLDKKESIQKRFLALDKKIMDKRKMMLDIEKENIMTIQSALRSIPKKPEEKKKSGMAAFLEKKQAGNNAP